MRGGFPSERLNADPLSVSTSAEAKMANPKAGRRRDGFLIRGLLGLGNILATDTMSLPTAIKELIGCLGLIPHPEG